MDITSAVAQNAKAIREQKKLTLDAAAELTGVSRSMLAQIEKGDVNPTISVLWKIVNGYKITFTELLEEKGSATDLIPCDTVQPLCEDGGRYRNYPTFVFNDQKAFECYRIVIDKDGHLEALPHLKGTEEYITVFCGAVEITVDGTAHTLQKGDSIRFFADVAHAYKNIGEETAEMSMLIYYNK
ncbi:MAG: helix-turn-helix transcriptional regulator [Clostridia bacterium]|nr:helix-turn-helix transcriptional regulator [Clostridia bacterium]